MSYLRKGLIVTLILMISLLATQSLFAYPRTVLTEYHSNTGCGPCVSQHQPFINMLNDYTRDQVVMIVYHVSWPSSSDPYYVHNISENNARRNYYGVNAVPDNYVDGTINILASSGTFYTTLNNRIGEDVPYNITVEPYIDGDVVSATVTVQFDGATTGDIRLHNVLVEELGDITPGSNGIHDYRYSMLDMMPSASGETVETTGAETLTFDYTFDYTWETSITNLTVISFLQNNTTREVYQAGWGAISADNPNVAYVNHNVNDDDQTYPNDRPDPGETVELTVTLQNTPEFMITDNLVGTLTCDNEDVVIGDADGSWANILPGANGVNNTDPFSITIPETFEAQYVTYTLALSDDSGYETTVEFTQLTGMPEILFINDHGTSLDQSEHWMNIFNAAGEVAEFYTAATAASYDLSLYPTIIWATSGSSGDVITASEMTTIEDYLDNGGKLILTGENIGPDLDGNADWFAQYFGAEHHLNSAPSGETSFHVGGSDGGLLPDAEFWLMNGAGNNSNPSTIRTAGDNSQVLYDYYGSPLHAGVLNMTDTFTSVYLGFNFEAISTAGVDDSQPAHEALIDLLGVVNESSSIDTPAETLLPTQIEVNAYPNPFNASVKIGFNLPMTEVVKVDVFNTLGRHVSSLHNASTTTGYHEVSWDATGMSSGIYLVRVSTQTESHLQKIMLVK